MTDTFVFSRLDSIEKRFQEVDLLLKYAEENQKDDKVYPTFCRSAHIILVAHFEGAIKEICKDVIDDINYNNTFDTIPRKIFSTFCDYFLIKEKKEFSDKGINSLRLKLKETLGNSKSNLKVEPFLFTIDRNLAPAILETILERFGLARFFWSLQNSDLDVVFEDTKTEIEELKVLLRKHISENVAKYPYTVSNDIYNPDTIILGQKSKKTLWEEFIDDVLKERHSIVHGQKLHNPYDHENLHKAKIKIEILIYAFMINLCSISNPIINEIIIEEE
jgi:hypothetical protein